MIKIILKIMQVGISNVRLHISHRNKIIIWERERKKERGSEREREREKERGRGREREKERQTDITIKLGKLYSIYFVFFLVK